MGQGRIFFLFVIVLGPLFSTFSHGAEDRRGGDAVQLGAAADLRLEPKAGANTVGRLPKGTVASYLADERDGFVLIQVELETGVVEGWVPEGALNHANGALEKGAKLPGLAPHAKVLKPIRTELKRPPEKKTRLPHDEISLLRREASFSYGLSIGGNFAFIDDAITRYTGMGFSGSGYVGYYLAERVPLRGGLGYSFVQGKSDTDIQVDFGFLDFMATLGYEWDRFEAFGGLQYSAGIGIRNIPTNLAVTSASDLSNLYFLFGAQYVAPVSDLTRMGVRANYTFSLLQRPYIYQFFVVSLILQFNG